MWVALALLAGLLQVLRSASALALGRAVPHAVNTWVRFVGAFLLCGAVLAAVTPALGWPRLSATFWGWTAACAACQSTANLFLVAALAQAPFSHAIVLHKLEVALTPLVGLLLFAERPSGLGWLGIALCALGAIALHAAGRRAAADAPHPPAAAGRGTALALCSALAVVFASFFLKQATETCRGDNPALGTTAGPFLAALHTLVHAAWMQSVALTLWLLRPGGPGLGSLRGQGRRALRLMLASASCSLCWFWAYSLALVAYVKAVGQVEVLGAAAFGRLALGETGLARSLPAILLVLGGILLVLLG